MERVWIFVMLCAGQVRAPQNVYMSLWHFHAIFYAEFHVALSLKNVQTPLLIHRPNFVVEFRDEYPFSYNVAYRRMCHSQLVRGTPESSRNVNIANTRHTFSFLQ